MGGSISILQPEKNDVLGKLGHWLVWKIIMNISMLWKRASIKASSKTYEPINRQSRYKYVKDEVYMLHVQQKMINKKHKNGFSETLLNLVFTRCMVPWFQICRIFTIFHPYHWWGFPPTRQMMLRAMRPPRTSARLPRKVPLGPAAPRSDSEENWEGKM